MTRFELLKPLTVEPGDRALPGDPQVAVVVFLDSDRSGVRQTLFRAVCDDPPAAVPDQHPVFGRGPQHAALVFVQPPDTLTQDAIDTPVEDDEPGAVEADETAERREPQVSIARLQDVV